jgi:hypothetical protein
MLISKGWDESTREAYELVSKNFDIGVDNCWDYFLV